MQIDSIKDINTDKIRKYMHRHITASKSDIARGTGLSFPTVTRLMEMLCASGEILEGGPGSSTGGRAAVVYSLNFRFSLFLLIRIEGWNIHWVIRDIGSTKIEQDSIPFNGGLLEILDELIRKKQQKYNSLKAVMIGIPAMVTQGSVTETYHYQELMGIRLPLHFQNLTSIPVKIENDMNILAMGHWHKSRNKVPSSVCVYWSESGLGAGVLLDGRVWSGASDFAGELTYLPRFKNTVINRKEPLQSQEITDTYVDLISMYAVIINPHQIILYQNKFLDGHLDQIRTGCRQRLPENALPHIEYSESYDQDYQEGLYALARRLAESGL